MREIDEQTLERLIEEVTRQLLIQLDEDAPGAGSPGAPPLSADNFASRVQPVLSAGADRLGTPLGVAPKDGALAQYRKAYRERRGGEPPPPLTGDLMFCDVDAGRAEDPQLECIVIGRVSYLDLHAVGSRNHDEIQLAALRHRRDRSLSPARRLCPPALPSHRLS